MLRIVEAFVSQLPGTRRHPDAKGLRKAFERFARNSERLEASVTDRHGQPRIGCVPPVRGGLNMRDEPAQELSTRTRVVDVQDHVRTEVRSRPRSEDRRLDLL